MSSDNRPCDPKVYEGSSFSEFVMQQKCDVDENLLKLFTDEDSFKAMLDKAATNVMCIGFIEVFNMTSEDSCTYDYLAHIPSEDFCKNSKALDVLVLANDSSVFDEHYRVVEVANFVSQHCEYMCSDATGSNELCWSFTEIVKFVMKHHLTTPPTITTTPSSDTPANTQPTEPSWFGLVTEEASDSKSTTVHDDDSGAGGTNNDHVVDSVDKSNTSTTGTGSASNKTLLNTPSSGEQSLPSLDIESLFSEDTSTLTSNSSIDASSPGHPEAVDNNVDKNNNISDFLDQYLDIPDQHLDTTDQHPDTTDQHPDTTDQSLDNPDQHLDSPVQYFGSPDLHPSTSSYPDLHSKSSDQNGDNLDGSPDQDADNLPLESPEDPINDELSHLEQNPHYYETAVNRDDTNEVSIEATMPYHKPTWAEDSLPSAGLAIMSLIVFVAVLAYVIANGWPVNIMDQDHNETV